MPTLIAMLRGVNLGQRRLKMDVLREICGTAKFECAKTYLQSGNVVFRTKSRNLSQVADILEKAIERKVGFHSDVILRNIDEMQTVVKKNPFANRKGLDPGKLAVTFLGNEVSAPARQALLAMDIAPEELCVENRELYIYFPNGQARTKLSWPKVEKIVGPAYTGRNWNTVASLLELAKEIDAEDV